VPNTYVSSISFNDATTSQRSAALAVTLTVTPKQDTITVRASPNADGMVSGGGTFTGGTSHAVTATPPATALSTGPRTGASPARRRATRSRSPATSPWSLTFDEGAGLGARFGVHQPDLGHRRKRMDRNLRGRCCQKQLLSQKLNPRLSWAVRGGPADFACLMACDRRVGGRDVQSSVCDPGRPRRSREALLSIGSPIHMCCSGPPEWISPRSRSADGLLFLFLRMIVPRSR
jgi:hypothetical protein